MRPFLAWVFPHLAFFVGSPVAHLFEFIAWVGAIVWIYAALLMLTTPGRALIKDLAKLLAAARTASDKLMQDILARQMVEKALYGEALTDDIRLLMAEQLAAILMAEENLLLLREKRRERHLHWFSIRKLYVPTDPENYEECVATIWGRLWPESRYPRYDKLTPEQRYICFPPVAKQPAHTSESKPEGG